MSIFSFEPFFDHNSKLKHLIEYKPITMKYSIVDRVCSVIAVVVLAIISAQSVPLENRPTLITNENSSIVSATDAQESHNFTGLFNDIKKLRLKKSRDEIKTIATVGMLSGALKVEQNMKENLQKIVNEFYQQFNASTPEENMDKIFLLEETMERDKRAIQILSNALDYARDVRSYEEYKDRMEAIAKDVRKFDRN